MRKRLKNWELLAFACFVTLRVQMASGLREERARLRGPSWVSDPWGKCIPLKSGADCGQGQRTRTLQCRFHNGSRVPETLCPQNSRPTIKDECNVECNIRTGE